MSPGSVLCVVGLCSLCHGHALCVLSVGCAIARGKCGCKSGMGVVIGQLIVSALATVLSAATVQGQEGHHPGKIADDNYGQLHRDKIFR